MSHNAPDLTIAQRACPVCEGTRVRVLSTHRFVLPEGHPLESGYVVVTCDGCGFAYADTAVTQRDLDEFYRHHSKYEDAQLSTGGGGAAWDQERLRQTAKEVSSAVASDARILDIGCANGGLLAELALLGHTNLLGMDPSAHCVQNTAAHGIEARQGFFSDLPVELGLFDCVIVSHVLEHIYDVRAAVRSIRGVLRPGGLVYAEVPDAERYHQHVVAPFQDFNTEHINHFSAKCLDNLFLRHGFLMVRVGHKNIPSSQDSLTPAVFCVFQQTGVSGVNLPRDSELRPALERYVATSRAMLAEINAILRELRADEPLIVWGVGELTKKLLCETVLQNHMIAAFVDRNPMNQGKVLRGTTILAPEDLGVPFQSMPIVIGSLLHHRSIEDDIRNRYGLHNPIVRLGAG